MNIKIERRIGRDVEKEFGSVCVFASQVPNSEPESLKLISGWANGNCSKIGIYRGSEHLAIHLVDDTNRLYGDRLAIITL